MCGRFAFYASREAVRATFGVDLPGDWQPSYNVAPSRPVPVIRAPATRAEGAWLRWGLIPSWARDPAIGHRLINARVETIASKPAFRGAFRHRRCVVLASGFYEWQAGPAGKVPRYISAADGSLLALAGLWESWQGPDGAVETCTIITTAATPGIARIHDRMPLLVAPAVLPAWLAGPAAGVALETVLAGSPPALRHWAVDRAVNNPAVDEPRLVEPATAAIAGADWDP
jgi:putative SOS response-associated peptidase YedK